MEKKKKILVTGGAGYIGSALVPKLLAHGYDVRVFDKLIFGDFGLEDVKNKIEIIQGDVTDPNQEIMRDIYGVIHLAGFSTEPTAYFNPRRTDQVNHLGTENIAKLAKAAGVERFAFASTCSVYFTYDTPLVPRAHSEEETVNCISPYSITKRSAEEALKELTDSNFRPTILRKGTIYGFSPKMRYDLVINSFTKDAFSKKRITVHAGGEVYRPMLDLDLATDAYIAAMELPIEEVSGTFNVVNPDGNWRIGDLADEFKRIIETHKNTPIEVDVQPAGAVRNYKADASKFDSRFGLKPKRTIKDAILEIWEKLQSGHDFTDPRFYTDIWHNRFREKE